MKEYADAPKPFTTLRKQKPEEITDVLHLLPYTGNINVPSEDTEIFDVDNPPDINVMPSETVEKKIIEKNLETVPCSEDDSEVKEDPLVRSRDWWNSDGKCDEAPKLDCYKDAWDSD